MISETFINRECRRNCPHFHSRVWARGESAACSYKRDAADVRKPAERRAIPLQPLELLEECPHPVRCERGSVAA